MSIHSISQFGWRLTLVLLGWLLAMGIPLAAQEAPAADVCDDLRYLMDEDITPFDLEIGGGVLTPFSSVHSSRSPTAL